MIYLLLINRLKAFFRDHLSFGYLLIALFAILMAWFYGYMLAGVIHEMYTSDKVEIYTFIHYICLGIFSLALLRMVFPTYIPLSQSLSGFYPISVLKRYLLNLLPELTSPFYSFMLIMIITCVVYLDVLSVYFLCVSLIALFGAHFTRRIIQRSIEFRKKLRGNLLFLLLLILILAISISQFADLDNPLSAIMLASLFLLPLSDYVLFNYSNERKKFTLWTNTAEHNPYLKLLLKNTKIRVSFLVMMVFKILVLLLDLYSMNEKDEHVLGGNFIYWLIISPLPVYTYIFNNIWGFWKKLWLNLELGFTGYEEFTKTGSKLIIYPLFLDAIITLPLVFLSWGIQFNIILFYVTLAIVFTLISFTWSVVAPKQVKSNFQVTASTSLPGGFISMGAVMLLSTIMINSWFYILVPFYIGVAFIIYKSSDEIYKRNKYNIYKKLFQ